MSWIIYITIPCLLVTRTTMSPCTDPLSVASWIDLKLEPPPETNTAKFFLLILAFGLSSSTSDIPLHSAFWARFLHRCKFLLVSEWKEQSHFIETHFGKPISDKKGTANLVNKRALRVWTEETVGLKDPLRITFWISIQTEISKTRKYKSSRVLRP